MKMVEQISPNARICVSGDWYQLQVLSRGKSVYSLYAIGCKTLASAFFHSRHSATLIRDNEHCDELNKIFGVQAPCFSTGYKSFMFTFYEVKESTIEYINPLDGLIIATKTFEEFREQNKNGINN